MDKKVLEREYIKSQVGMFYKNLKSFTNFDVCLSDFSELSFYNYAYGINCESVGEFLVLQKSIEKILVQEGRQFAIKFSPLMKMPSEVKRYVKQNYKKIGEDYVVVLQTGMRYLPNDDVEVKVFDDVSCVDELIRYYKIAMQNQSEQNEISEKETRALAQALMSDGEYKIKFYVAFLDGNTVSVLTAAENENFCGLFNISTNYQFQKRGVASNLINYVVNQNKGKTVFLAVYKKNLAYKLYKKLGFETVYSTELYIK